MSKEQRRGVKEARKPKAAVKPGQKKDGPKYLRQNEAMQTVTFNRKTGKK